MSTIPECYRAASRQRATLPTLLRASVTRAGAGTHPGRTAAAEHWSSTERSASTDSSFCPGAVRSAAPGLTNRAALQDDHLQRASSRTCGVHGGVLSADVRAHRPPHQSARIASTFRAQRAGHRSESENGEMWFPNRVDGDAEWVEDLIRVLRDPPEFPVMLLTDIATEIIDWIDTASPTSWERNAAGLLEELRRSCSELPEGVRRHLGPRLNPAKRAAAGTLRARSTDAERATLRAALSVLIAALSEEDTAKVAWDDLITALRDRSGSLVDARHAIAGLLAANRAAGPGESRRLEKAAEHVAGSNVELRMADPPDVIPHLDERLRGAAAVLATMEQPADCVAWISVDPLSVPVGGWSHGAVSLYDCGWAVHNAREDDGQTFAHRDELRGLIQQGAFPGDADQIPQHFALARIELPNTPATVAWEIAEDALRVLRQTASPWGTPPWHIGERKFLLIDGVFRSESWHSRLVADEISPHRIFRTGELFIAEAPAYIDALTARPLPALLREALRSVEEIDTRESLLPQSATSSLDERVSLGLRLQAAEHVAQWMSTSPESLIDDFVNVLATSRPTSMALDRAWDLAERANDDLRTRMGRTPGMIHIDLVLDHQRALLALCDGPLERAEARRWFTANTNAKHYVRVVAEEVRDLALLRTRHRRIRNAVVHGSPVNLSGIESVRVFARSLAKTTITWAIEAHLAGGPPRLALDDAIQTAAKRRDAASKGNPPVDEFRV